MNTTTAHKLKFDTETCTRCEGKGRIAMYGHVDNGLCLKCKGSRKQYSRKGRAAFRAYDTALESRLGKTAGDLVVGDVVLDDRGYTYRVDAIDFTEVTEPEHKWMPAIEPYTSVTITTYPGNGRTTHGMRATWTVRLHNPDVEAEIARDIADQYSGATLH